MFKKIYNFLFKKKAPTSGSGTHTFSNNNAAYYSILMIGGGGGGAGSPALPIEEYYPGDLEFKKKSKKSKKKSKKKIKKTKKSLKK